MKKSVDRHTSQILASLVEKLEEKDPISLKELIEILGKRGFGILILVFCIPNCLPIPNIAGLSALTGIPIGILGIQMLAGKVHPWFPAALNKKQFSSKRIKSMLKRAIPSILKLELFLHPRLQVMGTDVMQRLFGIVFIILATVMSLPIPFGNMLPGVAMALIAIGLIERDGVMIVLGLVGGAATFMLVLTAADAITSAIGSLF
jgi:hypothetical protein